MCVIRYEAVRSLHEGVPDMREEVAMLESVRLRLMLGFARNLRWPANGGVESDSHDTNCTYNVSIKIQFIDGEN